MAFDDSQKWVNFFGNAIYFAPRPGNQSFYSHDFFFPMTKHSQLFSQLFDSGNNGRHIWCTGDK